MQKELLDKAVANNAEWCSLMCQSHGISTTFQNSFWNASTRTPIYYPDAVTLQRNCDINAMLSAVDDSDGCSIKDSYADIDLRPHGFKILFEAQWIVHSPNKTSNVNAESSIWQPISAKDLAAWQGTWDSSIKATLFRPDLLTNPAITVLAQITEDRITAGAILNKSAEVVGLSNVFGPDESISNTWSQVLDAASRLAGPKPIVGYEHGESLDAAIEAGCVTVGPLRVWLK